MDKVTTPNITTPHNNLFIQVLSRKEKAMAFFEKYLPKPIVEIADVGQIELAESRHMSDAGLSLYKEGCEVSFIEKVTALSRQIIEQLK